MKPYKEPKGTANSILSYAKLKKGKTCTLPLIIICIWLLSYRNLMGEDLGPLSSKELELLERQLNMSLKQIRSIRVHRSTPHHIYMDFRYNYPFNTVYFQGDCYTHAFYSDHTSLYVYLSARSSRIYANILRHDLTSKGLEQISLVY